MASSVAQRPATPPRDDSTTSSSNNGSRPKAVPAPKVRTSGIGPASFGTISPTLPSPISIYQHIRRDSASGSAASPTSPLAMTPASETSGNNCNNYFPVTGPLGASPPSPRLTRAFSLPSSCTSGLCSRHHHRHGSVAIKFSPTYLEDPFYDDDDDASGAPVTRRYSASSLRRPPSPVAERILKGDIEF